MTTPVEIVINGRDNTGGAFSSAGSGLAKIGQIAMGILTSQVFTRLAQGVVAFGESIITEAREAAEVQGQLNAVLTSTNGIAGVTADMANELANSLQFQSKYTDEAILSGENMLLTFTNIGKDVFPAATQTILDMSAALGQDVTQSAMQLGKALNDPIQGVTALRRVGVQLTDEQENQVKQFMAVGDVASAQGVILDELAKEFGGSAKSQVNSLDLLKKRFDNIKESLGAAILPAIDKFGEKLSEVLADPKVQAAIENLVTWLGENAPLAIDKAIEVIENLSGMFDGAKSSLIDFITPFMPAIRSIMDTFEKMRPSIEKTAQVLGEKLFKAGKDLYEKVFPFLVETLDKFAAWFAANRPLIEAYAATMAERFAWIANAIVGFWDVAEPLLSGFIDLVLNLVTFIMEVSTGDWAAAWETIKTIVIGVWESISTAIVNFLDWIAGLMGSSLAQIKATWTANWNQLKQILSSVLSIIKSSVSEAMNNIKSAFSSAWSNIVSGVSGFASSLYSAVYNAVNNARNAITSLFSSFYSLGGQIITKIVDGLKNSAQLMIDYISDLVKNTINAALGLSTGTGSGGGGSGGGGGTPKKATGTDGWTTIPPGYPNDSFIMRVETGEQVNVIPASRGLNSGTGGHTVNNYFNPTINNFMGSTPKSALKGLT